MKNGEWQPIEALSFDDVLLEPQYSEVESRDDVTLSSRVSDIWMPTPIFSANMPGVTNWMVAREMAKNGGLGILPREFGVLHQVASAKLARETERFYAIFAAIGLTDVEETTKRLDDADIGIAIDVAHAHHRRVADAIETVKRVYRGTLIVGNIATADGARFLFEHGADIVRVGIGSGSICTTRLCTGFGVPQVTAIDSVARVRDRNYPKCGVIADGGIRHAGDIVKALALGADAVVLGSLLAGTTEASPGVIDGEIIYSGATAHNEKYREGVSVKIPPKGSVEDVIRELREGIASGLSYAGAYNIKELRDNALFRKITRAAWQESLPHIQSR